MAKSLVDIINLGEDYHVFISKCSSHIYDGNAVRVCVSRRYLGTTFRHATAVLEDAFNDPCFLDQLYEAVKNDLSDEACKKNILDMMAESD